jgi:hypothetical protein
MQIPTEISLSVASEGDVCHDGCDKSHQQGTPLIVDLQSMTPAQGSGRCECEESLGELG